MAGTTGVVVVPGVTDVPGVPGVLGVTDVPGVRVVDVDGVRVSSPGATVGVVAGADCP